MWVFSPGETEVHGKWVFPPGETVVARKTGVPRTRSNSVCIIGLLLYKLGLSANSIGLSANSQEALSRDRGAQ